MEAPVAEEMKYARAAKPATSTSVEDRNASDGDVDHTAAEEDIYAERRLKTHLTIEMDQLPNMFIERDWR